MAIFRSSVGRYRSGQYGGNVPETAGSNPRQQGTGINGTSVDAANRQDAIRAKEEEAQKDPGATEAVVHRRPNVQPDYVDFPMAASSYYEPIKTAPYKFTDVKKFAQEWGQFNRDEIVKNYTLSDKLAMDQLNTELKGLQGYAPAASALKRSETNADNLFNQSQRTAQVNAALPQAQRQLNAQAARAESFASGRMPSALDDRALELGIRADAADRASAGGFGASSSVAKKGSDLMSAQQRIALSQYGDQLLTGNIGTQASLFLAPTEYSNAGSQISVMPSISGSQLATANLSNINAMTGISTQNALSTDIMQNQYKTGLEQQTRQFNANNTLANDQFNVQNENNFALTKHQYDVNYEGIEAGIITANNVYENDLALADYAKKTFQQYKEQAQKSDQVGQIVEGGMQLGTALAGGGGGPSAGLLKSASGSGGGEAYGLTSDNSDIVAATDTGNLKSIGTTVGSDSFGGSTPITPTPIGSSGGAQQVAIPLQTYGETSGGGGTVTNPIQTFSRDSGIGIAGGGSLSNPVARDLAIGSAVVFRDSGLSNTPGPGLQLINTTPSGTPVYASSQLLASSDTSIGKGVIGFHTNFLDAMGVLDSADKTTLQTLAANASDTAAISDLDVAADGNFKSFANTMAEITGKDSLENTKKNKDSDSLTSAYSMHQLYQNWGQMSPAQKSAALASISLQNVKDSKGKKIADKELPATKGTGYKPLTAQDGYRLTSRGHNVPPIANNWETLNDIHVLAGGHSTPEDVAAMARGSNLVGFGKTGQAVSTASAKSLSGTGWAAAPHIGVGAITGNDRAPLPQGYDQVFSGKGRRIAVPRSSKATVAYGRESGSLIGTEAGHSGVSSSAQQLYKGWEGAHTRKANNGVVGGSAMVSGLHSMARNNPLLFSSTVATSFADPGEKSYNYKKDGDYLKRLGELSLSRLTTGEKKPKALEKLKDVGDFEKLTPVDHAKISRALRAAYATKGIKSKADAYGLTNQAFAEGRINAVDLVGMQKTFNMIYDSNGYDTAHNLVTGRERGVELAAKKKREAGLPKNNISEEAAAAVPKAKILSKEELQVMNRRRYAQQPEGVAA